MVWSDPNSDQKNEEASEGLFNTYRSLKKRTKGFWRLIKVVLEVLRTLLKAYRIRTELLKRNIGPDISLVLSRPAHPNFHGLFLDPCRARYVST